MEQRLTVLSAVAGLLLVAGAEAGVARGGRAGGGVGLREEAPPFRWFDSEGAALAAAAEVDPALPVMCFLRLARGAGERHYNNAIFARYDISTSSRSDFAAFRVNLAADEGKELARRHGIRQDGALLWYDAHGNCVSRNSGTLKVNNVTGSVQQWSVLLAKFEREVAKRVREARGHLERERYASAIRSLEPVADLEGPPAEGVREVLGAIGKRGDALIAMVDGVSHCRTGRTRILEAIAEEFAGGSVETRAREMAEADAPGDVAATTEPPPRPPAADAPGTDQPSIETMLAEVQRGPAADEDATATEPGPEPTIFRDDLGPDELMSAARERQREGLGLRKDGDNAGAFKVLTEALGLGVRAIEQKPGHVATRRYVDDLAAQRYECFRALVK